MDVIFKYPINDGNDATHIRITAPIIKPLKIDYQNGVPCLWAIVDTENKVNRFQEWVITKLGTGMYFDDVNFLSPMEFRIAPDSYLSTTFEPGTPFVWHWFVRPVIQSQDM